MTATFYVGDAIETLAKLPENSVDLILSSPPFLALRSYLPADHPDKSKEGGSQPTPGEYIDWLVDVVEACARVLAPHGSMCLELGDTYSGSGGAGGDYAENGLREGQPTFRQGKGNWPLPKSLALIPELFRFTLVYGFNPLTGRQTERWRLRNVIRWVRPNPPVGALGDKFRPATSELMVFCKSAKRFFDLDAVREPHLAASVERDRYKFQQTGAMIANPRRGDYGLEGERNAAFNPAGAPPLDWWEISLLDDEAKPYGPKPKEYRQETGRLEGDKRGAKTDGGWSTLGNWNPEISLGAPPLDWWNIPPGGYEGAHYAVFPAELCVKPIKAMCPEKVCRTCGEPSRRIVATANATDERQALADYLRSQREAAGVSVKELAAHFPSVSGGMTGCVWNWENAANVPTAEQWPILKGLLALDDRFDVLVTGERTWTESEIEYRDISDAPSGWTQDGNGKVYQRLASRKDRIAPDRFSDCGHDNWRPGLVLDPFVGSGTVLAVASGHGRDSIGIDLDERNYELALERVGPLMLTRGDLTEQPFDPESSPENPNLALG